MKENTLLYEERVFFERKRIVENNRRGNILYLVVPCYNEEEIIERSIEKLKEKVNRLIKENKISPKSKIMFVNDGSRDKTLCMLHFFLP